MGTFWLSDLQVLDVIGCILGVAGIAIAYRIARKQNDDVEETKKIAAAARDIASGTRDIAKNIQLHTRKTENAARLFPVGANGFNNAEIVYPANYDPKRPMYQLVAGDLQVVSTLKGVLQGRSHHNVPVSASEHLDLKPDHDRFFVCTPTVNSALREVLPAVQVDSKGAISIPRQVSDANLPCWFCERDAEHEKKAIINLQTGQILCSDSDRFYAEARNRTQEKYIPSTSRQEDFSIFLRLRDVGRDGRDLGRWTYVIAGIHTYGTWVLSDVIESVITDGDDALFSQEGDDLLFVVWGAFNQRDLSVDAFKLANDYGWRRRNLAGRKGSWMRWDKTFPERRAPDSTDLQYDVPPAEILRVVGAQ